MINYAKIRTLQDFAGCKMHYCSLDAGKRYGTYIHLNNGQPPRGSCCGKKESLKIKDLSRRHSALINLKNSSICFENEYSFAAAFKQFST